MTERGLPRRDPAYLIATWFGTGLLPGAPGTWGSLAALPVAWAVLEVGGWLLLLAASIATVGVGVWACGRYAAATGIEDPAACVVDEVAAQWLAIAIVAAAAPLSPLAWLAVFGAFRLFDIAKPWPANWADRSVGGGLGIMLDDVIAGAYAGLAVVLMRRVVEF